MGIRQRVNAILWPILGLNLEPETPQGDDIYLGEDLPVRLAFLAGKAATGSVLVEATADGALKVASTGSGLEAVEVKAGNATDSATDLALASDFTRLSVEVNDFGLDLAFEFTGGSYSSDLVLATGYWEFDLSAVDVRISNATAGETCAYKIWAWS